MNLNKIKPFLLFLGIILLLPAVSCKKEKLPLGFKDISGTYQVKGFKGGGLAIPVYGDFEVKLLRDSIRGKPLGISFMNEDFYSDKTRSTEFVCYFTHKGFKIFSSDSIVNYHLEIEWKSTSNRISFYIGKTIYFKQEIYYGTDQIYGSGYKR